MKTYVLFAPARVIIPIVQFSAQLRPSFVVSIDVHCSVDPETLKMTPIRTFIMRKYQQFNRALEMSN